MLLRWSQGSLSVLILYLLSQVWRTVPVHSPLYISSTSHVLDTSTLASEVNISDTSLDSYVSSSVVNAAHQVMMSDGAHINLSYVFLPKTKQDPLHFHISISLQGRKKNRKKQCNGGLRHHFIIHLQQICG